MKSTKGRPRTGTRMDVQVADAPSGLHLILFVFFVTFVVSSPLRSLLREEARNRGQTGRLTAGPFWEVIRL